VAVELGVVAAAVLARDGGPVGEVGDASGVEHRPALRVVELCGDVVLRVSKGTPDFLSPRTRSTSLRVRWLYAFVSGGAAAADGANGAALIFYNPREGLNGGRGAGYWTGTSTWQFKKDAVSSTVGQGYRLVCKTI